MSTHEKKSLGKNLIFQILYLLRKYPLFPNMLQWTVICSLISVLIGSASAGFLHSLNWATGYRENNVWIIAFLPLGGLLIGLLYHYVGKDANASNNLIIDTVNNPRQDIPLRMAPFVYIGTIMTHLLGGSAGREGTALQMAGSIAYPFSKIFKLTKSNIKTLMIAAVAGGFGSVFGTPLAGAVFALEFYRVGHIRYTALLPALITAFAADAVARFWQAPHTHYYIDLIPRVSFLNILFAILAGICYGFCATLFVTLLRKTSAFFKTIIAYPPLRPFLGGILVACVVFALGTTKYIGLGIPTMVASFEQQLPMYDFFIKMLLTVLTLSAGFKGGEVTPLFFIGATLGNALGLFIPLPMGLLAGMGFVAVFAGATNTPFACIVMALELFGVECGIYVAIACLTAYFISGNQSIYESQIIGDAKYRYFNLLKNWFTKPL